MTRVAPSAHRSLRERFVSREPLAGSFQKLASYHVTELLAAARPDYIVVDAEHAVFTRRELDACVLAARAHDVPALVRLANSSDEAILSVLDMGATGIVVPRVSSAAVAMRIVQAAHYRAHSGARGFSNSPRAGAYGRQAMGEHIQASDVSTVVICQIEDGAAVDHIDEIAAVPGIHGLLIGPADLTLSYRCDSAQDPVVAEAIKKVVRTARHHNVSVGIAVGTLAQAPAYAAEGCNFFVVGSDQSMVGESARTQMQGFHDGVAPLVKEQV